MVFGLSSLELQFLNIATNAVLTLGLIVIYGRLYTEQSDQSETMRRQTEIMEYNRKLQEQDYEAELDYEVVDREGDEIIVLVSNTGVGIGYKASLEIGVAGTDPSVDLETVRVPFRRYDESELTSPSTLFPDESLLARVEPVFKVADREGPEARLSRSEVVNQFDIEREEDFTIRLVWSDIGNKERGVKVRGIGFRDDRFQELVEDLIRPHARRNAESNYPDYSPNIEI